MDGRVNRKTRLRMDGQKAQLKGSPLRDLFKLLHKEKLPNYMFGCDIDFGLVEKRPYAIPAFVDLKRRGERVTFTEVVLYNHLLEIAPVYLVIAVDEAAIERGEFIIQRYAGGDPYPHPPTTNLTTIGTTSNWSEYEAWERKLRQDSKG